MTNAIFIFLISFLNVARGRKLFGLTKSTMFGRVVFSFIAALWAFFLLYATSTQMLIIWVGLLIWSIPGWGKYYSAFTGKDDSDEIEIWWIDDLGYLLAPGDDEKSIRKRGALCMGLRGLYMYPMFVALAWYNPWAFVYGAGCLLQGIPYWLNRFVYPSNTIFPEALWGALIGIMIIYSL